MRIKLEKQVEKLQADNKELMAKMEDLERSRRNNLRIIGLPEGSEGTAVAFMSEFFVNLLQDDLFTDPTEHIRP